MAKSSTEIREKPKAKAGKLKLIVSPGQHRESVSLVTPGSSIAKKVPSQKTSPVAKSPRSLPSNQDQVMVGVALSGSPGVVPSGDVPGHDSPNQAEDAQLSSPSSPSSSSSEDDNDSEVPDAPGAPRSTDSDALDPVSTHRAKAKHHQHLRVSCKNIVMNTFSGEKMDGIDAGAGRWWRKFSRQVNDAYMYTGSCEWPDRVKVSILGNYLGGMAEDWYDEVRPRLIDMTFEEAGEAMVRRFRTKRTDKQVMTEICNASKKGVETYEQFANRLKRMASLLQDGANAPHNARIILQTFCERAYPAKQESLEHAIDVEASDPRRELELAIEHLTKLSDSDGAIDTSRMNSKRRGAPALSRDWVPKRQKITSASASLAADSADNNPKVIERKQRGGRRNIGRAVRSTEDRFANYTCSICKELGRNSRGHDAKYHRRHPERYEGNQRQAEVKGDAEGEPSA